MPDEPTVVADLRDALSGRPGVDPPLSGAEPCSQPERTMDSMRIELLVVPECAHESAAAGVLTTALADVGLGSVGFTVVVIDSQEDADRRQFIGSPTICVDGEDVFPEPGRPASVACRLYPGQGPGAPELRDLRQAVKRAAALSTPSEPR